MSRTTLTLSTVLLLAQSLFGQNADLLDYGFFEPKTTIGGYGELHYNQNTVDDGTTSKHLDFHRFVLFYSHAWTERWSFKAEIELEHNFVKDGQGELELEQAYINYHHSPALGFQTGVVLPSVGLLNEHHEPPLFFSVERPDYAKVIIPTTWFGNGLSIYGKTANLDYKLTVMEGLDASDISLSGGIRGSRMKGYKAPADDLLYNLRLNYVGFSNLKAGVSASMTNAMGNETQVDIPLTLIEAHAQFNMGGFLATAEYGSISYGEGNLEKSDGYYMDFGYNIGRLTKINADLTPWVRISSYNTASKTGDGGDQELMYGYSKWMAGLILKPIDQVSFKIDYGVKTNQLTSQEVTSINLGAGYMF